MGKSIDFDDNVFGIIKSPVFLFVCVFKWSLLSIKKGWATPRLVSFIGLIQISDKDPHPFHMGVAPQGRNSRTFSDRMRGSLEDK